MKLCLLLCLSFVPWSQSYAALRHRAFLASGTEQKPTPLTQPQMQPQNQPQPQDPPQLNCDHMETLRAAHERERMQMPRGDKFNDFDWYLSKELNAVEKDNIVISPVSLKVVLAMLYEGARGKTAQEIGDALDIQNNTLEQRRYSRERFSTILQSLQTSEGEYEIKMGTHAFIDQATEVHPNYQCKLKTYYNSDIVKVDFSNPSTAVKEINNWAKNVTEGHIQDLISESEAQSSTIMLLLNAVYFKGQWEIPFPVNQTKPGIFHLDDKKTVTVPFMNVTDCFGYYNLNELGAHMVEMPYKGNKFSMYVLLPYNITGLDAIAKTLGPERSLSGIIGHMMPTNVNLIMPKFEFDFTTKLRSTLEKLGIKRMFSSEAELVDIAKTKSGGLVVSDVLQKSGISITEAGTVAYAATAVDLVNKLGGSEEMVDFIVDRPFLFFIEDRTLRTTVFVGKVTNPDNAKVVSTLQETPAEKPTGGSESGTLANRIGQNGQSGNMAIHDQSRFNVFDGHLLQAISKEVQGNFVISPASVKTLLGLILEAADETTLEEIKEMLQLPNNSVQARQLMGSLQVVLQKMNTSQVEVDSETQAFVSKDQVLNSSYANVISDLYKAGVTSVDFKSPENAANRINSWVRTQTRGKIPFLIDPDMVDPETMAILVNTVYFNGKWKEEFQLKDTKEECFYSEPNLACNKVPIMYKKDELNYRFDKGFNSHIVQLPYKDERFSMVLLVPATVDGARKIAQNISRLTFPTLLDKTRFTEVHLKMPKFSVEYESDLKLTLTKMGLNTVFSNEAKLPFMINKKQGRVSAVIHKAKIEVNEKGTKAAAASGAEVVPLMSGNEAVIVTADHPFYYYIYEVESRSVLFCGRISSLTGEATNEENLVGAGAEPLPADGFGKPSYAQVANSGSASSPRPQINPNRQPSYSNTPSSSSNTPPGSSNMPMSSSNTPPGSSNMPMSSSITPTNTDIQFLGYDNKPYNIGTPNQSDLEFPDDLRNKYLEDFKKRHQPTNFPSQQRSRSNN